MEALPLEEVRAAFEVNLFGQLAIIQASCRYCSPRPHRQSRRRGGAHRHPLRRRAVRLEGGVRIFSDALRLELHPLGLHVCSLRPARSARGRAKTSAASRKHRAGRRRARYGAMFRRLTARAAAVRKRAARLRSLRMRSCTRSPQRRRAALLVGKDARALSNMLAADGPASRSHRLKMLGLLTLWLGLIERDLVRLKHSRRF